jgi:hypothetical protein
MAWSVVAGDAVDGSFAVFGGGQGVGAGGLEALAAHELGDDDDVVFLADHGGAEGVAEDVAGEFLVEVGVVGDGGDDVVGAAGGEPAATGVEQQGGVVVGVLRGTEGFGTKSGARACFCWSKGLLPDVQYDGRFGQPGNPTVRPRYA